MKNSLLENTKGKVLIFEAIKKGFGIAQKAWLQILLFIVTNLVFRYISLEIENSWVLLVPILIAGVYLNVNVMVKVKSIYENTDKGFVELLKESRNYIGKIVVVTILLSLLIMLILVAFTVLTLAFYNMALLLVIALLISLAVFVFMYLLVNQGIVLRGLSIKEAFSVSKLIFKKNKLKFLGLSIITLFLERTLDIVTHGNYSPLSVAIPIVVGVIYTSFINIVLCVVYYQATQKVEDKETNSEAFIEVTA